MSIVARRKPRYVYLVAAQDYGHSGFLKVGVTCDYKSRIRQLNLNTPFPIVVIAIVEDSDPLWVEAMVLEEFNEYRIKGEWFFVKSSRELEVQKCSHREFMRDFNAQAKSLTEEIKKYLLAVADGEVVDALL